MMDDIYQNISNTYKEQTQKSSDIARKIAFALIGVIWAIIYIGDKENISGKIDTYIVFFFLCAYFFTDVLQYFITACKYKKHYEDASSAIENGVNLSMIKKKESKKRERIDKISFCFFVTKFIILTLAILFMFFMIIRMAIS